MAHTLTIGDRIDPRVPRGYYIDLRVKAEDPRWPPQWLAEPPGHVAIAVAQFGLGCHERFLAGDGDVWFGAAISAGDWLVGAQFVGGTQGDGGWYEQRTYPHTYPVRAPWLSGMAQGQGASLLVRVHAGTGDERYAEAAARALLPFRTRVEDGGIMATIEGGSLPQEYPTELPSHVLNGALFALWGVYDVAVTVRDVGARLMWDEGIASLIRSLRRWDTGYWSRYDLYPHPVVNVASPGYHWLHMAQLRATALVHPNLEIEAVIADFERYAASAVCRSRALAHKIAFRLLVPRSGLGRRLCHVIQGSRR